MLDLLKNCVYYSVWQSSEMSFLRLIFFLHLLRKYHFPRSSRQNKKALKIFHLSSSQPSTVVCKMEAQLECVYVAYTFSHVWAPIRMLGQCLLSKFLRRSSVGEFVKSVLLVGFRPKLRRRSIISPSHLLPSSSWKMKKKTFLPHPKKFSPLISETHTHTLDFSRMTMGGKKRRIILLIYYFLGGWGGEEETHHVSSFRD